MLKQFILGEGSFNQQKTSVTYWKDAQVVPCYVAVLHKEDICPNSMVFQLQFT